MLPARWGGASGDPALPVQGGSTSGLGPAPPPDLPRPSPYLPSTRGAPVPLHGREPGIHAAQVPSVSDVGSPRLRARPELGFRALGRDPPGPTLEHAGPVLGGEAISTRFAGF